MKIILGSNNKAKYNAVLQGFAYYDCEVLTANVASGVSEQPFSDEETAEGAINRAKNALKLHNGDIGIGLEGGVVQFKNNLFVCNWGALVAINMAEPIMASGAKIPLPDEIARRLSNGQELGPVMDEFAKRQAVRQNEGAVGIFTNGNVNRSEMFLHIMKLLIGQYEYKLKKMERGK